MPDNAGNPLSFIQELKRRKVVRVIIVYAAASFVILELASIIQEPFGLPDWTIKLVFVILFIGLIITIILSWIYDITPEGIEKTKPVKEISELVAEKPSGINAWKIATIISVIIIVGFVILHIAGERRQTENIITELEKTIAVLPFVDMSPQKDQEYFCDGIAEEIINALTNVEGLDVIARTSAFSFKGKQEDIREIGNKLGAGTILEGSVRKEGNRLRITAQLIKVEDGSHIWSEKYDRDIESIFDIQDEISLAIVENLKIELLGKQKSAVVKRHTENLEAFEYFLRGNEYYWRSYEEYDWNMAIKMYQKAIELDPNFALAYTKLAMSHLDLYFFHHDWSEERLMKSKQAIDAAFKIEPELTEAYLALGRYYYVQLDYSQSLKHYSKALNQSPNNWDCIFRIAAVHRRAGNWDKAVEGFKKAFELDPRSSRIAQNTGSTFEYLRDYSEALHYYDIAILLNPDWNATYRQKSRMLVSWIGNTQKARITLKEAIQMITFSAEQILLRHLMIRLEIYDGNYEEALTHLSLVKSEAFLDQISFIPRHQYYAQIYGLMDNPKLEHAYYDSSRMILEDTLKLAPGDSRFYSSLGMAYAGLGRKEEAIVTGEKAVELRPLNKDALKGTFRVEDLARIYVMVGEHEKALGKLELLLSIPGTLSTNLLKLDPVWKPLWDHPEFKRLIEKYSEN